MAIVNLLATQWGDHHTSVADLPAAVVSDPSGEHLVVMGSENRQNMLGHIGLLGAADAVLPMASAGPPEARMGDPLDWLMGDWAEARTGAGRPGGRRPLPVALRGDRGRHRVGRIDAVEMQALTPGVDGPSIREWYRFLSCGYRLPVVGGTDKMSAEIPLGAIRTYARLDPDVPLSFGAWAEAVRAGRTFVSSGAFIDLRVEGCAVGDTVRLGREGGTVEVVAEASAAQPVIDGLELIHDGASSRRAGVGRRRRPAPPRRSEYGSRRAAGWPRGLPAASRSIPRSPPRWAPTARRSTSTCRVGRPSTPTTRPRSEPIIDGARTWIEQVATVRSPASGQAGGRARRQPGDAR